MKTLIISPYARPLRNGGNNPKNFPYWSEVVSELNQNQIKTIQIGLYGEPNLDTTERLPNLSLKELKKLVLASDAWISVDNFMGHLGDSLNKKGIVIFGKSDPLLFGYPSNINLLKDRKYLRPDQWRWWEDQIFDPEAFVPPNLVLREIRNLLYDHT